MMTRTTLRSTPLSALAAVALTLGLGALAGCGGVELERAPGAPKHRALPLGTPVTAAETADALPQPTVLLGTLRLKLTSNDATADRTAALAQLKRFAARYGCDAVVAAAVDTQEKIFKRKIKKLGSDGRPYFEEEVRKSYEHNWQSQCVRTAAAPADAAPRRGTTISAKPAGGGENGGGESGGGESGGGENGGGESGGGENGGGDTTTKPPRDTRPNDTGSESGSSGSTGGESGGTTAGGSGTTSGGVIQAPSSDDVDPAMASEVARAFLGFSRFAATSNHEAICKMLDKERVYLDIRIESPATEIKTDLTQEAACQSLAGGDLGNYLRNFGPAEVHTEMPTLIPSLFRIHGGAFLKLDESRDQLYRKKLAESRAGKAPLACEMYTVHAAGNLFKISLDCRGVKSYRLLMRRDGPDDFKLMALTHNR
ncbi:MAG: hypothetical protein H6747_03645 [Deltaproteobacteria bacterium]|nr:hypothetical protein [Deltaproteobacteria bacterium]